jgi:hypothetical protein
MLSSPKACVVIARVSVAIFPRFEQNLMLFPFRIHRQIASGQICDSTQKNIKNQNVPAAAWKYVHGLQRYASTNFTVASHYCNFCTHGSISPENYGYPSYVLKYNTDFLINYWAYKNYWKWDPVCSMHNPQSCDAVLWTDLHLYE